MAKKWKDIKHKKDEKKAAEEEDQKQNGWLYAMGKRKEISARLPRDKVPCPECGEEAERAPNGRWRCTGADEVVVGPETTLMVLNCCARGYTLPDGSLVTSEARSSR